MTVDPQISAIYGATDNTSRLQPGDWNPSAQDSTDFRAMLADGIRGITNKMIGEAVGDKYASGQLYSPNYRPNTDQGGMSLMPLLLIGGLVYLLAKS
jgi:hypothetical protein